MPSALPVAFRMAPQICVAGDMSDDPDPYSLLPRRYIDGTPEAFEKFNRALEQQREKDLEFARANASLVVEGPWGDIPAQEVAYVGIARSGERVRLPAISSSWRYNPRIGSYDTPDGERLWIRVTSQSGPIVLRILLGRELPGALVGRAQGQAPMQARGLVDGKEFYFRSRGDLWQMHIGGADTARGPEWFYQEDYGKWPEAGSISEDQAYDFIEKAFALFRSGSASMKKERWK
jgi:hypothetical protein